MPHELPQLPNGWAITTVQITETTTYRVHVAHPQTATPREIATAGYDDYGQQLHPETVFDHDVGADEVVVGGQEQDIDRWPDWAGQRPDHDAVTAILAGRRDRKEPGRNTAGTEHIAPPQYGR